MMYKLLRIKQPAPRSAKKLIINFASFCSALLQSITTAHSYACCLLSGGEAGIRTLGGLPLNGFQDRRFRPLSHLSSARREEYLKIASTKRAQVQITTLLDAMFLIFREEMSVITLAFALA
tara:strand:- start:1594 stop:1956 length:363 start_codon:yes stop_codon:yes gene_type:complete